MTLPTDEPMPEPERPFKEDRGRGVGPEPLAAPNGPTTRGKSTGARIGGALVHTITAFLWSSSGRVQVDKVPWHGVGLDPTTAPDAPKVPTWRDKWIGAAIVAALILSCGAGLRWWVG